MAGVDLDQQQRARDLHGDACSNAGDNYYAGDFGSSPGFAEARSTMVPTAPVLHGNP
jgi:hypothetical protein